MLLPSQEGRHSTEVSQHRLKGAPAAGFLPLLWVLIYPGTQSFFTLHSVLSSGSWRGTIITLITIIKLYELSPQHSNAYNAGLKQILYLPLGSGLGAGSA